MLQAYSPRNYNSFCSFYEACLQSPYPWSWLRYSLTSSQELCSIPRYVLNCMWLLKELMSCDVIRPKLGATRLSESPWHWRIGVSWLALTACNHQEGKITQCTSQQSARLVRDGWVMWIWRVRLLGSVEVLMLCVRGSKVEILGLSVCRETKIGLGLIIVDESW